MRRTWMEVSLGEAPLEIIDGDRGKAYPKHDDFSDNGYCLFLNATNVTKLGFEFAECQFITEQKDNKLRKGNLLRNDVVLTTRGTLGNAALYGDTVPFEEMRINSGMVIMRADSTNLLPRFLYGFLRSPSFLGQVEQLRSGVAQQQLPIRDLKKIKITLPPKSAQEQIVDVFSAYDDLIENNNRRIKLLEESARLLYQEWFIRLRFPGYEHTRIVGGVPEGWEKTTLKTLGTITTGKTPSTARREYFGGNIPFIKTPDMHGNVYVITTEDALSDEGAGTQQNKFLEKNAIIVSCIGAKAGVVSLTSNKSQTNQQINALSVHKETQTFYLYFFLKDFKEQLLAIGSSGSTMPNVSKGKFENIEVVVPSERLLSIYHEVVSCSFEQILNLHFQNQNLKAARDLLLPRLVNGEIVV